VTGPLPGEVGEEVQAKYKVLPSLEGIKGWVESGLWVRMVNPAGKNIVRVPFHALFFAFPSVDPTRRVHSCSLHHGLEARATIM